MFHSSITFYVECNQIVVCNITDITTSAILIASNNDVIDTSNWCSQRFKVVLYSNFFLYYTNIDLRFSLTEYFVCTRRFVQYNIQLGTIFTNILAITLCYN